MQAPDKKEDMGIPKDYDRWACPLHLGVKRRRCPICGAIFCPKCDEGHISGCRDNNNVGN